MTDLYQGTDGLSPEQSELFALMLDYEGLDPQELPIAARGDDAPNAPLSHTQERFWFLNQMAPDSPAYNEPIAMRLQGALDRDALTQALTALLRRHSALRVRFVTDGASLAQTIEPVPDNPLTIEDLRDVAADNRLAQAQARAAAVTVAPMDFSVGPLYRFRLFQLDDQDHLLLIVLHHGIADGFSLRLLMRELSALYAAFCAGQPSPLPDVPLHYTDYAAWERAAAGETRRRDSLSYWRRVLSDAPDLLALPTDHPRQSAFTFHGATERFAVDNERSTALRDLSAEQGVTLFMTMLAAFQALLHRYARQDMILVGTPVSSRERPELETVVGSFANNLVLHADCADNPRFVDLLAQVSDTSLEAFSHQAVPFEKVVEAVDPKRDAGYNPLFQVAFLLHQNTLRDNLELSHLRVSAVPIETGATRFDIDLMLEDTRAGLVGTLHYNTDLFEPATIARLIGHYQTLLQAVVDDPQQRLSDIALLEADERGLQLETWNNTAQDYDRTATLHGLIARQADRTPEAVAVVDDATSLTYGELEARANALAAHLCRHGAEPGKIVGVMLERRTDLLVGLLGVLKSGAAYLPLDPGFPKRRLSMMLEDSAAPLIVSEPSLAADVPDSAATVVDLCDIATSGAAPPDSATAGADDLAYVIFTSGSTGRPKGVQISHRNVVNFLTSMAKAPGLNADDRLLAVTTTSFDISVLELFLPLTVGATVVLADRDTTADGDALAEFVMESGATVMQATPATWQLLIAAGWNGDMGLKALCGGEALTRDLARSLKSRVGCLWNMYGPTETTIWSTCAEITDSDDITVGRPIANTQIYVLDTHRQPAPIGVPGELFIGGDGVARGYLNRPDLTAERFVPDPFRAGDACMYNTGDLARLHDDGRIEHLGRVDSQVKVRGFRIELGEIESALSEHDGLAQAAVAVRHASPNDARLIAYTVNAVADQPPTVGDLRKHLRQRLPDYMIPQKFVELDRLPLTANNKVDRLALPNPFEDVAAVEDDYVPPRTPAEKLVAGIWQDVLGGTRVGANDNFFEVGGHSLLAMQVIARIRQETGQKLSPRAMILNSLERIAADLGPIGVVTSSVAGPSEAETVNDDSANSSLLKRVKSSLFGPQ